MTKHERVLDSAMERINKMVESSRQEGYQNNRAKSENKSYKQEMSDFLGKQNLYRNLNQKALKDIKILNDASIIETFTKEASGK